MKTIASNNLEILKEIKIIINLINFKLLKQIIENIIKIIMNEKKFKCQNSVTSKIKYLIKIIFTKIKYKNIFILKKSKKIKTKKSITLKKN